MTESSTTTRPDVAPEPEPEAPEKAEPEAPEKPEPEAPEKAAEKAEPEAPEEAPEEAEPEPAEEAEPAAPPRPGRLARFGRFIWSALLPVLIPGALMLWLGLLHADRPALSWDEVTSAEVSQRSIPQIWDLIQNVDAVFGFYYAFLHYWTDWTGTSELQLRLPSIIAMAGAVAVAAELGRRLFTPLVGLTAGLVLCAVPNTSRYAAEVRPYAFACFFSVLALVLLVAAVRRGGAFRWIGYGLSVVFLGLFHLVALTTLVAHAALVGLHARHARRWGVVGIWAGVLIVAVLPLLPLLRIGTQQDDIQLHWVEPITPMRLHTMLAEIVGSPEVGWLLGGLALAAWWRPGRRLVPVALLAVAPALVLGLVSVYLTPMWVARYLLVVLAPLAILAAVALAGDRTGRNVSGAVRSLVVLLLFAGMSVPAHQAMREPIAKNGPDYRSIAALLAERQEPGDVIVYPPNNRATRAGMDYYLARLPLRPADPLVQVPAAETGWLIAQEHPDAAQRLTGARRIWFVAGDPTRDPVVTRPDLRLFFDGYKYNGYWLLKHSSVVLYVARG